MQNPENSENSDNSSLEKRKEPLDPSGDSLAPLSAFVTYIVKNLVKEHDKVRVSEGVGHPTIEFKLSVEKSDIGKVIGKKGKTIHAIRTILTSVASRLGLRVSLEILEEPKDESRCENSCENSEGASRCEMKSEP